MEFYKLHFSIIFSLYSSHFDHNEIGLFTYFLLLLSPLTFSFHLFNFIVLHCIVFYSILFHLIFYFPSCILRRYSSEWEEKLKDLSESAAKLKMSCINARRHSIACLRSLSKLGTTKEQKAERDRKKAGKHEKDSRFGSEADSQESLGDGNIGNNSNKSNNNCNDENNDIIPSPKSNRMRSSKTSKIEALLFTRDKSETLLFTNTNDVSTNISQIPQISQIAQIGQVGQINQIETNCHLSHRSNTGSTLSKI